MISPGNVVVIAITATLAAIGSASIPNSALVSMVTVLQVIHTSQASALAQICHPNIDPEVIAAKWLVPFRLVFCLV